MWKFLGVLGIGCRYYRSVYVEGYRLIKSKREFAEMNEDRLGAEDLAERLKEWSLVNLATKYIQRTGEEQPYKRYRCKHRTWTMEPVCGCWDNQGNQDMAHMHSMTKLNPLRLYRPQKEPSRHAKKKQWTKKWT